MADACSQCCRGGTRITLALANSATFPLIACRTWPFSTETRVFWTIRTPSRKIKTVYTPFGSVVFSKSGRVRTPDLDRGNRMHEVSF